MWSLELPVEQLAERPFEQPVERPVERLFEKPVERLAGRAARQADRRMDHAAEDCYDRVGRPDGKTPSASAARRATRQRPVERPHPGAIAPLFFTFGI